MPDPTLDDVIEWVSGVYELQTTDPVLAGPGAVANRQAQELANRTAYLKNILDGRVEPLGGGGTKFGSPDVASAFVGVEDDGLHLFTPIARLGDGVSVELRADLGAFTPTIFTVDGGGSPNIHFGDGQTAFIFETFGVRYIHPDSDLVIAHEDIDNAAWARKLLIKGHATSGADAKGGWVEIDGGNAGAVGAAEGGSIVLKPGTGTKYGNVHVIATPASTQGMGKGTFLGDASAAPTGNPAAGFFHWSDNGVPKWRDADGRIVRMDDVLVFRGAYSGATSYVVGDTVTYNGGLYRATSATTGNLPTDVAHWDSLAGPGATLDPLRGYARAVATTDQVLVGAATIDGVVLATGDVVLCVGQTTAYLNGPWKVVTSGAWTRPSWFVDGADASAAEVVVGQSSANWKGTQWLCTSTRGNAVVGTNGLTWKRRWRDSLIVPVDAGALSWLNQGDATVSNVERGARLDSGSTTAGWRVIYRNTALVAPFTVTMLVQIQNWVGNTAGGFGLVGFNAGTQAFQIYQWLKSTNYAVSTWTNPTTYSAQQQASTADVDRLDLVGPRWVRFRDDNVNRYFEISRDGRYWMTVYSTGRATLGVTCDRVGFAVYGDNAHEIADILSWEVG
jgi:hypothetical protein